MRLASQFIQSIIHTNTNVLDRLSKSLFEHARGKHHATKKLEKALPGKKSQCMEPCKGPRKSIWSIFGSSKKQPEHSEKKKASETYETGML